MHSPSPRWVAGRPKRPVLAVAGTLPHDHSALSPLQRLQGRVPERGLDGDSSCGI